MTAALVKVTEKAPTNTNAPQSREFLERQAFEAFKAFMCAVQNLLTSGGGAASTAVDDARTSDVMTVDEAALFLGVDRNTVYEYTTRGVIPHQRLGKRILLRRGRPGRVVGRFPVCAVSECTMTCEIALPQFAAPLVAEAARRGTMALVQQALITLENEMSGRRDQKFGTYFYRKWVRTPDGHKVRVFGTPKADGLPETRAGAEEAERRAINWVLNTGELKKLRNSRDGERRNRGIVNAETRRNRASRSAQFRRFGQSLGRALWRVGSASRPEPRGWIPGGERLGC